MLLVYIDMARRARAALRRRAIVEWSCDQSVRIFLKRRGVKAGAHVEVHSSIECLPVRLIVEECLLSGGRPARECASFSSRWYRLMTAGAVKGRFAPRFCDPLMIAWAMQ